MLPDPVMTDVASSWTALFAAVWFARNKTTPPVHPREASHRRLPPPTRPADRVDLFTPAPSTAEPALDDTVAWPINTPRRLVATIDTVARRLQALPEPHDLDRRSLRYRAQLQRTLRDARHALARLDEGTYGTCIECAAPISLSTLTEKPWASVCSRCAAGIHPACAPRTHRALEVRHDMYRRRKTPSSGIAITSAAPAHPPADVGIVGAGIVGLSTAWFLQERGVAVTVYDSDHAASGASWGNAGWLTPALTAPLPEPDVLRYGVRSALTPTSPVYVPPRLDPSLWRFLAGFARHCTLAQWQRGMAAYVPLNRLAIRAFDDLADAGATPRARHARPFLACYRTTADAGAMLAELQRIQRAGQIVHYDYLTGPQVRQAQPAISEAIDAAVLIHGQRYLHPPMFVRALADSVIARGGKLRESVRITGVETESNASWLVDSGGARHRHDAVVLATGAALSRLARPFGVRSVVHPGRGYSFTVTGDHVPDSPVYFPGQRVACTPLHEPADHPPGAPTDQDDAPLLRVAGMMEFRRADEPLDPRRVRAIVDATRDLLPGVDLDHRRDEWVGSRPCTTDGLPLIGATSSPRVFVAGGHGMWGVALGPATGKLLTEQIVTGHQPEALGPFDPLR